MTARALAVLLVMKNRECHKPISWSWVSSVWPEKRFKNGHNLQMNSFGTRHFFLHLYPHLEILIPYWSPIYIFSWTQWFVRFFAHRWTSFDRLGLRRGGGGILSNLPRANTGQASTSEWLDQTTCKSGLFRWWTIIKKHIFK